MNKLFPILFHRMASMPVYYLTEKWGILLHKKILLNRLIERSNRLSAFAFANQI